MWESYYDSLKEKLKNYLSKYNDRGYVYVSVSNREIHLFHYKPIEGVDATGKTTFVPSRFENYMFLGYVPEEYGDVALLHKFIAPKKVKNKSSKNA